MTVASDPSLFDVVTTIPFNLDLAQTYTANIAWPAFWISVAYVVVIFSIKSFMANRKPFDLTRALNFWNGWLAVFSSVGAAITGYALLHEFYYRGVVSSYTNLGEFYTGWSGLLSFLFLVSKIAEFGDTIFIVLRKKPLIFLHWYHHALTMNYGFYSYNNHTSYNTWIIWMNFSVHSIMYGYFTLRSFGVKVPAWIAQNITSMQILQFIVTHFILFHVGYLLMIGAPVQTTATVYWFCLLMEMSYVALFGNFYYQSYMKGGGKKYNAEKKKE